MKIGKKRGGTGAATLNAGRPATNQSKKTLGIVAIVAVTALLIVWVFGMSRKAEETVTVIRLAENVYKNETITAEMLEPYDMLKAEFEKYATVQEDGTYKRRVLLYSEANMIIGSFAAYPLKAGTYAEYRDFYTSRVDNSDNIMYSFPGKEIVSLDIAEADLQSFKTFLQPGDRVNIVATFTESEEIITTDIYGMEVKSTVETFKSESVFNDIMIADLLNSSGESILDIYADYEDMNVTAQAALSVSESFQESVQPVSMLVALTSEEKDLYYYYAAKNDVEFRMSMPQRVE